MLNLEKPFSIKHVYNGVQYVFKYENGYGASVVQHDYSYGGKRDLWEVGLIRFLSDEEWILVQAGKACCQVIGDASVAGYLQWDGEAKVTVEKILAKIQALEVA